MPDVDTVVPFWNENGIPKLTQRTPCQVEHVFDGLDLHEPGVVPCSRWRVDSPEGEEPADIAMFGEVGRKRCRPPLQ